MSLEQQLQLLAGQPADKTRKLLFTLRDKEKYVLHERILKLYLTLGLRLKKVNRVLRFRQSSWMRPNIELNTKLRTMAPSGLEKNFFMLMNNSVFGKTMENLPIRINVKLVRAGEEERLGKLTASPLYARHTIFGENLPAIHIHKDIF